MWVQEGTHVLELLTHQKTGMNGPSRKVRGMCMLTRKQENLRCHAWTGLNLLHPQIEHNEEGMQLMTEAGQIFQDVHLCWLGPIIPVLRLVDPAFVAPLLQAPGIHSRMLTIGFLCVSYLISFYPWIDQAEQQMGLFLTVAMAIRLTC